ncbi:MAG TPA: type II secretion system F family protein [Acidimicrobiales bacterium]|nr:type II secretion system F family protein [Acidimicrobiales bacterium]
MTSVVALVGLAPLAVAAVVAAALAAAGPSTRAGRRRSVGLVAGRPRPGAPLADGWISTALRRAGVDVPAPVVGRAWAGLGGVGAVVAVASGSPVVAIVGTVGVVAGPPVALHLARHRGERLVDDALPGTLEAVASSLRGGSSLPQALDEVARRRDDPAARQLAVVAAEAEAGLGVDDALERFVERSGSTDRRLAVAALLVGSDTGAPPGRAVDGVAATLRDRRAAERELVAQATQARASVGVLVAAPLVFALAATSIDPRVGSFLVGEPLGLACLVGGLALDALGAWWMRAMVRGAR